MKTSYFYKVKNLPIDTKRLISIARSSPDTFFGAHYLKLAPPWDMLNQFKIDNDEKLYTNHYRHIILGDLDASQVYRELTNMGGENAILL